MEIRELTKEDLHNYQEKITDLICENLMLNLPFISNADKMAEEKYFEVVRFKEDGSAVLYGAFEETMIGFLWAYEREVLGEKRLHLTNLIVDSNVRGNGIGGALIKKLHVTALERKVNKIELWATMSNENAVSFYKKCGFDIKRLQMEMEIEEHDAD